MPERYDDYSQIKEDIYSVDKKLISLIFHIEKDKRILAANRKLILEFKDNCMARSLATLGLNFPPS